MSVVDTMVESAQGAERDTLAEHQRNPRVIERVSNVADVQSAREALTRLRNSQHLLRESSYQVHDDSYVSNAHLRANESVMSAVESYIGQAEVQATHLGAFQSQVPQLTADYDRVLAELTVLAGDRHTEDLMHQAPSGGGMADAVAASGGTSISRMNEQFREHRQGTLAGDTHTSEDRMDAADEASHEVVRAEQAMIAAQGRVRSRLLGLHYVRATQQATETQEQLNRAQQPSSGHATIAGHSVPAELPPDVQSAETAAEQALAAMARFVAGDITSVGQALSSVQAGISWVESTVAKRNLDQRLNTLRAAVASLTQEASRTQLRQAMTDLQNEKDAFVNACGEFAYQSSRLHARQNRVRSVAREVGESFDRQTGNNNHAGGRVGAVLGEARAYVARADAALAIAHAEQQSGASASTQIGDINNPDNSQQGNSGTRYYRAEMIYHNQLIGYRAVEDRFRIETHMSFLPNGQLPFGAAGGMTGVNHQMNYAVYRIQDQRDRVNAMAERLQQAFSSERAEPASHGDT